MVSGGIVIFGLTTVAASRVHALVGLSMALLLGGAAWIVFISLFNVLTLNLTPDWVRARVLAVSMLVFQGAVAAGSAAWGALAGRIGIHNALLWCGMATIATAGLGLFLPLPNLNIDVTPWIHWPMPRIVDPTAVADADDAGPILSHRGVRRDSGTSFTVSRGHAQIWTRPPPRRRVEVEHFSGPGN